MRPVYPTLDPAHVRLVAQVLVRELRKEIGGECANLLRLGEAFVSTGSQRHADRSVGGLGTRLGETVSEGAAAGARAVPAQAGIPAILFPPGG